MSFQFRQLKLRNWLVYGGEITLDFEPAEEQHNLVVIFGKNGFGKTSLLKALEFVFHGRLNNNELLANLHDNVKTNTGYAELEVTLRFDYDGDFCQLTRKAEFDIVRGTCNPSVKLIINGENREGQVQDIISQIIPAETQQFVFFDGAEITRYSRRQHEDGVKEAIEQILGIPAIRNLREDLLKLTRELEDEQAELVLSEGKHNSLLHNKTEAEEVLSSLEEKKRSLSERIIGLRELLSKLQGEELEVRMLESDSRVLQEKQSLLADYSESHDNHNIEISTQLSQMPLRLLTKPLASLLVHAEAKQVASHKRALSLEKKRLIKEILDEGICICERDIDEAAAAVLEKLINRIDAMTSNDGSDKDLSLAEFNQLSRVINELQAGSANPQELITKRATTLRKIEELETDIQRLMEKLQGHENTQISELYSQKAALENQLRTEDKDLIKVEAEIEKTLQQLNNVRRELDQFTAHTSQGEALNRTLQTSRSLYMAVSEYVEELVEHKRQLIEQITSEIFLSITNKPEEYAGIHVKPDYTLEVYRRDDTIVDNDRLSAGEKEVLAYSFITALNLSTDIPAPFVMDTPFGHLDATHRNRLLDSLPRLSVQVFLLATDRDLPPSERERIEPFIKQKFIIERDQRSALSIIEQMN